MSEVLYGKPIVYLVWNLNAEAQYDSVVYCTLDRGKAQAEMERLWEVDTTFYTHYCIEEIELS